ncbi:TonB-dependent receptor [soil metagenome]
MKKITVPLFLLLLTLLGLPGQAQDKVTYSGYLRDAASGEALIGATVSVQELGTGAATNTYGFFSLTLPKGTYTLIYSYVGFQTKAESLTLTANLTKDVELPTAQVQIKEVQVTARRSEAEDNVRAVQMSVQKLDIRTIKAVPALFGEVDVVRAVQLLPGVTTVGEGATGFNVRGGSVDQNLILLDEAPVYNSSHLMGLFSVFNPDAVKDVKLYKGGIPAAYGGRLSSLLDVRMKEGNAKKREITGGIGTIMTRLAVEAPIVKDKASFIIAGRRSYMDVLAQPFLKKEFKDSRLFFYDLSTKVNYKINDKNTVFASGYFGRDVMKFGDQFQFGWGNKTGTLRWNHVFNQKLFSNVTLLGSNYDYSLGVPSGVQKFEWKSNIINYSGKADFDYFLSPSNTLSFGASAIRYQLKPGVAEGGGASIFNKLELPDQHAWEQAAYLSNEQKVGHRLTLQYGLRGSFFNYLGNRDTVFTYADTQTGARRPVVGKDISALGQFKSVATYFNLEPRFSANLTLSPASSLKASYNRTTQYLHLISNTTAASPLDVWAPTSNSLKPQLADQVALGYFRNFGEESQFETSAEVYYKDMQHQVDYVDGAELLLNPHLEGELLSGRGRAYGLELYAKKNSGKLTGWVSYTLSRTERLVPGVNNKAWYASKFDRPHNLAVVGIYELSDKWSFSSTFTYLSGTPATFPNTRFVFQGLVLPHNTDNARNHFRIPDYHRLDLSATLKPRRKGWLNGEWVFSAYNVYARRNAFSIYTVQKDGPELTTEARRISVFGSIIPSATYNFKF